jgi:hypothetical protein
MTELYYDDPVIAAYMMREFGVNYYTAEYGNGEGMDLIDDYDNLLDEYTASYNDFPNLFVHSDSLYIFYPQVGDMVIERGRIRAQDRIGTIDYITKDEQCIAVADYHDDEDCKGVLTHNIFHKKAEILQRNGEHFFMPKGGAR